MKMATAFILSATLAAFFLIVCSVAEASSREKRASVPLWMSRIVSGPTIPSRCTTKAALAAAVMAKAYLEMRNANWLNCDHYFHCRANYDARQFGYCGRLASRVVSEARELLQIGTAHGTDSDADREANDFGRRGGNCVSRYILHSYGTDYECSLPQFLWRKN